MRDRVPTAVTIADGVLYQRIQDEAVLLNMDSQQFYGLNWTATRFWESLLELHDIQAAEDRLCAHFGGCQDSVRADLETLVATLLEAGLVKAADPVAGSDCNY